MIQYLKELFRYKELLIMIVWRDIKIKYKQSIMGLLWAIFMPMLIIAAGILVKYAMAIVSGKPMAFSDISTLSVKALPWGFFIGSIRFGTNSLIGNSNLVSKIYFPKEIFPIAAVFSNFFDTIISGLTLTVILSLAQIGISIYIMWIPYLMLVLIIQLIGLSMILSATGLFFRDVKYIVEVLLTFGIFFTPVFYEADMFGKWANVLLLNPVAPILEAINACVILHRAPDLKWLFYSTTVSFLLLGFGYTIFKKLEPAFAESV